MTEELDGNASSGTELQPSDESSQKKGDSSGSFDTAKLQSALETIARRLDEVDARSRSLQGDKDRGVNKAAKDVEELKAKIAEYEKLKGKGLDADEAIDEISFRDDVRQIKEQLGKLGSVSQQVTGTSSMGVNDAVKAVFDKAKVDPNLPEVVSLLQNYGNDPVELALQVGQLRAKWGKKEPPMPGGAPAISGVPLAPADNAKMIAELNKLYLYPTKNREKIAKLEKELEDILPK